jgi:hypothetical protein
MNRNTTDAGNAVLDMEIPAAASSILCTAPPGLGLNIEKQIEDQYGVAALGALEDALRIIEGQDRCECRLFPPLTRRHSIT